MTVKQQKLDAQRDGEVAALERLVVENDDLLALESRIGRFNIFDALSITHVEIRHSNFLAFILDPAESHGQGQIFLKAILMDILKAARPEKRPLSPIDLDGATLNGVEVRREWEHIDLLITCQQPPFVVVIENKVKSQEHSNQLSRYEATVKQHYPNARPFFVYLTLRADHPSGDAWVPYSYAAIHRVLDRVRKTYSSSIGEDVLVFLDHYLSLIGTQFMNDPTVDELCQRIYKNHRRALDLIFERVGSRRARILNEAESALRDDDRWYVFWRVTHLIDFVPKAWLDWLPRMGLDDQDYDSRAWFVLRFELYEKQLDFYVEVRRMADLEKRREIIEKLISEGPKFGFKHSGREITDSYTRVSGRERVLKWDEDDEPDSDAIRAAVRKKLDEVFPKLEGVPPVLKSLLKSQ